MGGSNGKGYPQVLGSRGLTSALELDLQCAATARVPILITAGRDLAARLAEAIHNVTAGPTAPFRVIDSTASGLGAAAELTRIFDTALREGYPCTLFLPDIDAAPSAFRSVLSRWVTSSPMQPEWPTLIASTVVALEERVEAGQFDARLFYRLNSIHIRLTEHGSASWFSRLVQPAGSDARFV